MAGLDSLERELHDLAEKFLDDKFGPDYEAVLDEIHRAEREAEREAKLAALSPEELAAAGEPPPGVDLADWATLSPAGRAALAGITTD
jgi:hypothetical protein